MKFKDFCMILNEFGFLSANHLYLIVSFTSRGESPSESVESGSLLGGSTSSIGSSLSEDVERHLNYIGLGNAPFLASSADVLNETPEEIESTKTVLRRCSSECNQPHSHCFSSTSSPRFQGSPVFLSRDRRSFNNKDKEKKPPSLRVDGALTRSSQRRSFTSLLRRTESKSKDVLSPETKNKANKK